MIEEKRTKLEEKSELYESVTIMSVTIIFVKSLTSPDLIIHFCPTSSPPHSHYIHIFKVHYPSYLNFFYFFLPQLLAHLAALIPKVRRMSHIHK